MYVHKRPFSTCMSLCTCMCSSFCVTQLTSCVDNVTYTLHPIQVKLLQSLGLRSTLITDGSQPVNLFTTAQGLLGAIGSEPSNPEEED